MAQYNSKHTGSQIDSAVARALAGGSIDQSIAKIATESTDYPGCYYRMVDGAQEWINPPMSLGMEYRTTERYLGKPVYVKAVDFGALPNASYKFVGVVTGDSIIRASGLASNGKTLPGSIGASQSEQVLCMGSGNSVQIITYADASSLTATVTAWYTKTTD